MRLRPPQVHDAQLGDGAIGRGRLGQGSRLSGHVCRDQPLILEPALGRHPGAKIVIAALDGANGLLAGLVETIRRGLGRISAWHDWAPSQLSVSGGGSGYDWPSPINLPSIFGKAIPRSGTLFLCFTGSTRYFVHAGEHAIMSGSPMRASRPWLTWPRRRSVTSRPGSCSISGSPWSTGSATVRGGSTWP